MSIEAIIDVYENKFIKNYLSNYSNRIKDLIKNEMKKQVEEKIAIMILEENNIKKEDIITILKETEDEVIRLRGLKTYFKEEINIDIEDVEDLSEFKLTFLINSKNTIDIDRKREELLKMRNSKYKDLMFTYEVYSNTVDTNNEIFLGKKYGRMTKKEHYKNIVEALKMSSGITKILLEDELKNLVEDKKTYKLHNEKTMLKSVVLLDTLLKHNIENNLNLNEYFLDVLKNTYNYYQFYKDDTKISSFVTSIVSDIDNTYKTEFKKDFTQKQKTLS